MTIHAQLLACLAVVSLGAPSALAAPASCPAAVGAALAKHFPKSTIHSCKREHEDGRDQIEAKLTMQDGHKAEVDVALDGTILQVEELVALNQVPVVVMKAFAAKYPKAKASRAEKQTPAKGPASYEIAFEVAGARKEATFTETGTFVEEE